MFKWLFRRAKPKLKVSCAKVGPGSVSPPVVWLRAQGCRACGCGRVAGVCCKCWFFTWGEMVGSNSLDCCCLRPFQQTQVNGKMGCHCSHGHHYRYRPSLYSVRRTLGRALACVKVEACGLSFLSWVQWGRRAEKEEGDGYGTIAFFK